MPARFTRRAAAPLSRARTRVLVLRFNLVVAMTSLAAVAWVRMPGFEGTVTGWLVLCLSGLGLVLGSGYLLRDLPDARTEAEQVVVQAVSQTRTLGERRLAALLAGTTDLVLVLNAEGRVTFSSAPSMRVLGYTQSGIRGRLIDELLTEDSGTRLATAITGISDGAQVRMDLMAVRGDGRHAPVEVTITSHLGEQIISGYVVAFRDISHLSQVTAELARQSHHDPLTTLPNRRLFHAQLTTALRSERGGSVGVIVADVDKFKAVNTSYGAELGDKVLIELASLFHEVTGPNDTLARLDGDSFALVLPGRTTLGMTTLAKRLMALLANPLFVEGHEVPVRVSLGLAQAEPDDGPDEVYRNAEVALAWAKQSGGSQLARYEREVHHRAIDQLMLRQDLDTAIRHGQLKLVYQSIVDLSDSSLHGVEALVRWDHPIRGSIPPNDFVPMAEQSGMMIELGNFVLRRACLAAARMQRPGAPLMMSVNISALQLAQPDFVMDLLRALDEASLDPGLLMLEITETAVLVSQDRVIPRLAALRSLGVHISVDDFGTGYSSLNYLTRLPLDELKVDKSFVDRVPGDPATESVVRGMLEMSNSLGLITVGEGIETHEQARWLHRAGCTLGQGYLWSRPIDEDEVLAVLDHVASAAGNHLDPAG
ncbi:MAG: putative bifunctional diguanylate cyclase/phosphodiesterase [Actinomycetales bacterium]